MLKTLIVTAAAMAAAAQAQTEPAQAPVVVVVSVPTPAAVPRAALEAGMRKAVDEYRRVPGLLRKYFTVGEADFGGVYLFRDRAAADAWFSPAWRARVVGTYGKPATLSFSAVPAITDNTPAGGAGR